MPNTRINYNSGSKPPLQFKSHKGRMVTSAQGVSAFGENSKEFKVKGVYPKQSSIVLGSFTALE